MLCLYKNQHCIILLHKAIISSTGFIIKLFYLISERFVMFILINQCCIIYANYVLTKAARVFIKIKSLITNTFITTTN